MMKASANFKIIFLTFFICYNNCVAQEAMPERDNKIYVQVKAQPNVAEIGHLLEKGTSTINGIAHTKGRKGKISYPVEKQPIFLLPHTEYTKEWLKLYLDKAESRFVKNQMQHVYVELDDKVEELRRSIITNSAGDFVFDNLKPGKYIVYAEPKWVWKLGMGGTQYFPEPTHYNYYDRVDFLYDIVDIKGEGDTKPVKLTTKKVLYQNRIE